MDKSAANEYKIHSLLADRWSTVCFSKKSIPLDILMSLMEAARWSPSSRNLQPWRFLTISKKNYKTYKKVLDCLSLNNQEWANAAPLFIVSAVEKSNELGENSFALYDLGSAVTSLILQATSFGLKVHQMGGFNREQLRKNFLIPENFIFGAILAVGYLGDSTNLSTSLQEREQLVRERKEFKEFVYFDEWGNY